MYVNTLRIFRVSSISVANIRNLKITLGFPTSSVQEYIVTVTFSFIDEIESSIFFRKQEYAYLFLLDKEEIILASNDESICY